MNKRTFIHKPSELLRIGKEIVKQSDDQRYIRKVTLVNMMLERKMKAEEISELSGVTRRTLSGWVKIADEEGFDALRGKARTGRSSKLSKEQKEEIKNALINPPKESGYYKWDGISLSDYIKSQYDIDLSVRQCQRLFHELGFSKIRPQIHPSSGELNEEERKAYKKIADLANNPNAILVFQDEVHYKVQTSISSMWAIKGSKPKVKSYPGKDNISYSGFVIPSTGELFTCKPQWFNYETTISSIRDFLNANPVPENCKYYLIMDNAPWHKKARRLIKENSNQEYSDIADKVVFVYLPPYSPDLNPIEQVWRLTRRDATHNIFFRDVHELEQAVDEYYSLFNAPNTWLKSLCSFKFDNY